MKILRTITFWTLCTFAMACPASNFYFRTVTVRDGLADNYVRNIVRDHEGYIWISTINGLSRYDGMRFQNYTPMRFGAKANDVTSVSCSGDSTTWMLCINELFTYDRNNGIWKKDGSERLKSLGIKGSMKTFYIDDKHNSWVETDYALYYYDYAQRNLSMIPNYNRLPIAHIISKNGTTIVVTTDYKILLVSDKKLS
ncbi:MAG: hypothetical protein J5932_10170 [Prevotella sp.]|nr:hypothetical protein [Prevotella sp.]